MDIYTTEEQQIEAIKKWWQENAIAVVFGIALGLCGIFGWRHWQNVQQQQAEAASSIYQQTLVAVRERQYDAAEQSARQILTEYPGTHYAVFSQLLLAKIAVDEDKLDEASAHLKAALKQNKDEELAHLLRIRLARVLLSQQKTEAAATLIEAGAETPGDFAASYAELAGDIKQQQGNLIAARTAYQEAMIKARASERDSTAIEIKLNDIGQSTPPDQ